jgi:hypothetical protein
MKKIPNIYIKRLILKHLSLQEESSNCFNWYFCALRHFWHPQPSTDLALLHSNYLQVKFANELRIDLHTHAKEKNNNNIIFETIYLNKTS